MTEAKHRVSEPEYLALVSVYVHLASVQLAMEEGAIPWDDSVDERGEEVCELLEKAPCAGSMVDWPTLKRIREIEDEVQAERLARDLETEAVLAFEM